jgi:hypothetical protein
MLKLLEIVLQKMGYEVPHVINGNDPGFTEILIRKSQFEIITGIKVNNKLLYNENLNENLINKLTALLFNNIWFENGTELTEEKLQAFIEANYPSNNPDEKILRILNYIRAHTKFDGQKLTTDEIDLYKEDAVRKLYLFNRAELEFYIRSLYDLGYIRYTPSNDHLFHDLYITTGGISKLIVENEKSSSKDCFVAMSFDSTLRQVYDNAISPAIKATGFEPVRIDDDHKIPSEFTINDAILAGIKKAKFIIADFTDHKKGVYFEAGYALGRGLNVIYTCRVDQIDEAHFDTRNYPHIVWKDADDLKKKLIDKIEVFIKV